MTGIGLKPETTNYDTENVARIVPIVNVEADIIEHGCE